MKNSGRMQKTAPLNFSGCKKPLRLIFALRMMDKMRPAR
ncbi:Uncharacterized protein dnm_089200 [Desulfonema magnum]|uniref:Uncharacterized protein n=1 Tax=Desulfonema magnum TaxID=45655 RepID=A0A975BWU2_9BACT|nr:Uncharacterized protein dnm_089200 [Desulfonema magnum]